MVKAAGTIKGNRDCLKCYYIFSNVESKFYGTAVGKHNGEVILITISITI